MNLKDFLASREKPPELYWSLVLEKGWVQAGIWYIGASAAEMVNISPGVAWQTDEELISACDAALSSAVANLPENYTEPNKTVFGVPAKWVKSGEISDDFIPQIKQICTDLSLTPVGFVVLPEAIAHLYKSEEGTPLSAVIVGLGTDTLEVSVFKLGNLAGTTTVARSVSLIDDVAEGLSRFEGAAPLPSRIIVYDGKGGELNDAKDELMKATWDNMDKVKFLHTPKAEVLISDRKVLATSLAGANEIGHVATIGTASQINMDDEVIEKENSPEELIEETPPIPSEIENIEEPQETITPEELGFTINSSSSDTEIPSEEYVPVNRPLPVEQIQKTENKKSLYLQSQKIGTGVKKLFHGFSSKIKFQNPLNKAPNFAYKSHAKAPASLIIIFVLLAISTAAVCLWFLPKATVTVYVSPKTFQEQVSLSFNFDGKFDESRAIIPGVGITATATGDKTKSTTGTKLIGEKAKGSVQIANGNTNPIHLSPGTMLTSSAGLKFVTDVDASISGQLIPGSPGVATLSVTAGDLGAQYNLAKGEVFKVGLFDKSQVAGTSQVDFSGGSSQQIAAVSADDQKKLETDLKNELSGQLLSTLSGKVDSDQVFINDLSSKTVTTQTFDHKVGEVADTLKLSLTLTGTSVAADKSKLLQYATDSLKSKIPEGYALKSSQIGFKFSYIGSKDGNVGYNADVLANFLPYIKADELSKQITGKKTTAVIDYLSKIPGYVRAEIKLNPPLPEPFKSLPYVYKNIKVDIVPED